MCWFITIGVSAKGASAVEALGHRRAGLGVRVSTNASVAVLFSREDRRFELTHGGCSCDLMAAGPALDRGKLDRMRRRYNAQGWSDAKITRAIQAAETAGAKAAERREDSASRALFRNVVIEQVRQFGSVRLLAHFYSGSQDEEQVVCTGRRCLSQEEFLQGKIPEDVLVEIVA